MSEDASSRILLIAVWYGAMPPWFPLWVQSCRLNDDIDWLLITDSDDLETELPPNIHLRVLSMDQFAQRISEFAGVKVAFSTPYKACDFRPLFSCLIELVEGEWDFWGHCDLDVVFGRIREFITAEILEANDRILGLGHLSLYRNSETANEFFRRPHRDLDYRDILSDPAHRGFDEHRGVNRLWQLHKGRFYENESVVADIDPNVRNLRRTVTSGPSHNRRRQAFGYHRGRVVRVTLRLGRVKCEEYMYIHFQKRSFSGRVPDGAVRGVWLTPSGFIEMDGEPLTRTGIHQLNPVPFIPTKRELLSSFRALKRAIWRPSRSL